MQQPAHLYDSAITVYSPDGRIYQVEYAREVVKRGSTVVGVTARDGIGFLAERRVGSRLAIQDSVEKIFMIDDHVAAASCGLVADARTLVSRARVLSARHKYVYDDPVDVQQLSKEISDHMHSYTQSGGARPFGVAMLIGGLNDKARIYETDPSGAFVGYKASAVGNRRQDVMNVLERDFEPGQRLDDALSIAYTALTSGEALERQVEGAVVTEEGFRRLGPSDIEGIAESAGSNGADDDGDGNGGDTADEGGD